MEEKVIEVIGCAVCPFRVHVYDSMYPLNSYTYCAADENAGDLTVDNPDWCPLNTTTIIVKKETK